MVAAVLAATVVLVPWCARLRGLTIVARQCRSTRWVSAPGHAIEDLAMPHQHCSHGGSRCSRYRVMLPSWPDVSWCAAGDVTDLPARRRELQLPVPAADNLESG